MIKEIAAGGMGVVYKARQVSLNRSVALKMIRAGSLATPAEVQRFRMEAEATANLDHPNIVPIYEIGAHRGQRYFTMRLIEGQDLARSIQRRRYSPRESAQLMITVARAVHSAHQHGILHRDLKPSNILLDTEGQPHVTDFGLARLLQQESSLTQSLAVMGTPSYMAPEQACGQAKQPATSADIYSLGAVLYELLAGRPPFQGLTALETLLQVHECDPRPPHAFNPAVDRDLETICLKCLEKDPGKRYSSAGALAEDLDRWLRHEPIRARPITPIERVYKWTRRRPALAALVVVSSLALVALVWVGVGLRYSARLKAAAAEADRARSAERSARREEERQRKRAEGALAELTTAYYIRNITLAEREWLADNTDLGEQILDDCAVDRRAWEWHFLKRLCFSGFHGPESNSRIVANLSKRMFGVAFSSDSKWLACAGDQGIFAVDPETGDLTLSKFWRSETGGAGRLVSSARRDLFAWSRVDGGGVRVLEGTGGDEIGSFGEKRVNGSVYGVALSPEGDLLATADGGGVKIWPINSAKEAYSLGKSTNGFMSVAFSGDGNLLAAADCTWRSSQNLSRYAPRPNIIRVWDVRSRRLIHSLEGHRYCVWQLAFSPDSKRLASVSGLYGGGAPGELKLWDLSSGREESNFVGHDDCLFSVAFTPDGTRLATGGGDIGTRAGHQGITLWDVRDGRVIFSFHGHKHTIYDLKFSADGRYLASASSDGTVRVWDGTPLPPESPIDLSAHGNRSLNEIFDDPDHGYHEAGNHVLLPQGLHRLGRVRFDIRRAVQVGQGYPLMVSGIPIGRACRRLQFLHAATSARYLSDGMQIGTYIVHFVDGKAIQFPLLVGQNIADARTQPKEDPKNLTIAWTGVRRIDDKIRLFKSTWESPDQTATIRSIDLVANDKNTALFLAAITAE